MPKIPRAIAEQRQELVVKGLRKRIAEVYGPGGFLPSERSLATELGVSRPMLRKGIKVLLDSDELVVHPGVGIRAGSRSQSRAEQRAAAPILGLLLPDLGSPFFLEITESIEYAALQHGYQVLVCNSRHQTAIEERHLGLLADQRVAGVILAHDPYLPFPKSISLIQDRRIPYVALFNAASSARCDSVSVDDFTGIYQAMRYLASLGHKAIGFCRPVRGEAPHPRETAYVQYNTEAGILHPRRSIISLEMLGEKRYTHELAALLNGDHAPTAFVAGNDQTALLLMRRLQDLGRRVPEDISIIGFDNLAFTEFLPVALTTINQPTREMGRRAVEMLLEHINLASDSTGRTDVFETHLIIRDSCAVPSR
jgi:DNA-binding LacI/PurR family transcriptional regulator